MDKKPCFVRGNEEQPYKFFPKSGEFTKKCPVEDLGDKDGNFCDMTKKQEENPKKGESKPPTLWVCIEKIKAFLVSQRLS